MNEKESLEEEFKKEIDTLCKMFLVEYPHIPLYFETFAPIAKKLNSWFALFSFPSCAKEKTGSINNSISDNK